MKTQLRYEPHSQRNYKLGVVIIGNVHRVLCSLQGSFGTYCNATDYK